MIHLVRRPLVGFSFGKLISNYHVWEESEETTSVNLKGRPLPSGERTRGAASQRH